MDARKHLIIIKGKDQTDSVASFQFHDGKCEVVYTSAPNKTYGFQSSNVEILPLQKKIDPAQVIVIANGQVISEIDELLDFGGYYRIVRNGKRDLSFRRSEVQLQQNCLMDGKNQEAFQYFKETAAAISLVAENGINILSMQYDKIQQVSEDTVLASYLAPQKEVKAPQMPEAVIYPFGLNQSQKLAVERALSSKISIIQGPPGTGKTQTILNIIANVVRSGKTVAVVSNNNSATHNVAEKLEKKNADFLTAFLGSLANKQKFLETQTDVYPNMSEWVMSTEERRQLDQETTVLSKELNDMSLSLMIYTPTNYIMPSKLAKYIDMTHHKGNSLTQQGREEGIRRLMSINLLKRLESSVASFRLTIDRIKKLINDTIGTIKNYQSGDYVLNLTEISGAEDFDYDDQNTDFFSVGKKVKIDLADMDYVSWMCELEKDAENLELLSLMIADITPEHDTKLQTLFDLIRKKIEHPINPGNKKIIIFTAFSDTADYLFANVSRFAKENFGLETAEITGTVDGKTTIPKLRADLNTVLTCFSPVSKGKSVLLPGSTDELDILIATDCISEGQNLQDCDYLINYDIHWNPVRIIQRFGRIDRIGSRNDHIQLVNFWPDMDLDEYINLKSRVETRMKISVMTSTGDDDLINAEEKGDLEYRRAQLKRLQEEVVDIEDMTSGISIMDLGLNEFRLDLLEYMKQHEDIETAPKGLHTVVGQTEDSPAGVIFVLRNINDSVNIDNRNRIHPFYMVYISEEGEIVCDYLNPKKLLDTMRLLCRGKGEPCAELCKRFNDETDDGRKMSEISELLSEAINSIIDAKEENDIDSLFKSGGTSALLSAVSGLDDFELICFLVVK